MKSGTVKWFDSRKGFGFITDDDPTGEDVFIHLSAVERAGLAFLFEGQALTFEVRSNHRGARSAVNVSSVEKVRLAESSFRVDESPPTPAVIEVIRRCNLQLVDYLQKNPEGLYTIHPATFEDIVARIYENEGFVVEFHKAWNQADGGVDIIAVRKDEDEPIRFAIQCKRYSRENRITAETIRALAGVLDPFRAHVGVLATTSYFTKSAEEETRNYLWRVRLRDYNNILSGIMKIKVH